jgi:hypothetical protein
MEASHHDIAQGEVAQVVERFQAIGEDVEKFNAFLSGVASKKSASEGRRTLALPTP